MQNKTQPEDLGTYYESILEHEFRREKGIYYTPQYIVDYMPVAGNLVFFWYTL